MTAPADVRAALTVFSPRQLESIRDSASPRVCVWEGSIRSGKTIGSLIRWCIAAANPPPGGELVIFGRTRESIWRNVIAPIQNNPAIFGVASANLEGNYGAPTVRYMGRLVHIIGAHDAKAELVIRGMTVALAYGDELTTVPRAFFAQMLGRMSVEGAQMFGTTNPDNPAHWLKADYLDDLPRNWARFHFTIDDNPYLARSYVEQIKREYKGLWFRRFILGEWVAAEGAVYPMWDPDRHVIPHDQLPDMQRLLVTGVDYGTSNPSAGLLLGLGTDNLLYLVDEWRTLAGSSLTDGQQSAQFRSYFPPDRRGSWVAVDPAAASFKAQLFRDGVRNVQNAENDVAYGIKTVATLLATGQLRVSDRCPGFIAEAPGYSWDTKASAKGLDKPLKTADHSLDGGRYAVATGEVLWSNKLADGPDGWMTNAAA